MIIKDVCNLRYFLGVEVASFPYGINLCRRKYITEFLSETGMLGVKPVDTLMEFNSKLLANQGELLEDPVSIVD